MSTPLERLREAAEKAIGEHDARNIGWGNVGCLGCAWSGDGLDHAAHVAEAVVAAQVEALGLVVEPRSHKVDSFGARLIINGPVTGWTQEQRLVSEWQEVEG